MRLTVKREAQGAPGDAFLRKWGEATLRRVGGSSFVRRAEVSLVLCGDAKMRSLNHYWRGKNRTTDVLSFPQMEGEAAPQPTGAPLVLGDVVISLPTARRQAREAGKSLQDELAMLWVHGLLHLAGYAHATKLQEKKMFTLQDRILKKGTAD